MYAPLQISYLLAHSLVQGIQAILVPLCFVVAWLTVGFVAWTLFAAVRDSLQRAKQMHRIPCSQCQYFSGNYLLKCPVHPDTALSEAAINCPDFESTRLDWGIKRRVEQGWR